MGVFQHCRPRGRAISCDRIMYVQRSKPISLGAASVHGTGARLAIPKRSQGRTLERGMSILGIAALYPPHLTAPTLQCVRTESSFVAIRPGRGRPRRQH